jgi:glycine/D-amino acid oxidase-like deaminating enzyme/nitrite reductase/ring-hydroxylating ferredoxin subunit
MDTTIEKGLLTSGEDLSFWIDSVKPLEYPTLSQDMHAEVLIVGGGISGLTTAYCLLKSGRKIVLVEDGYIGSGETGRTTAHITAALDDGYYEIEKVFGKEGAARAAESHTLAINLVEQIVGEHNIDCDFKRVDGYLFLHPSDKLKSLRQEFEATQNAGLSTVWVEEMPVITQAPGPAIKFPKQAQFHILKYLQGLARAVEGMGGKIFTRSRAVDINKKGATCNGYKITAESIVVATNTPVNDFFTMHTKQFPYRTYVVGLRVPKGNIEYNLWWDTGDMDSTWVTMPYHYVRLNPLNDEYDLLISGGEDHKTGQADKEKISEEERYDRLETWTRDHFPMVEDVVYRWSGQVMEPVDYMAFIGRNPGDENVYIITGDSGNGMTHGTLGGMLITDLINGISNEWEEIYSPKRIPVKTPGTFITEMFNTVGQYGDYITKADIKGLDELGADSGAILGKGFKRIAVYRDANGNVNSFSAVCPHMGCVVQWNPAEKSFDCPCHGSRFTKEGEVVNGPASKNLDKVQIEK